MTTSVTASDGITLAVHAYTGIDPKRPTILAVHGYPDNHHVWDGVASELSERYNVVAYDVRGAGESGRPPDRSGYEFPQLVSDIGAVIDSLGVGRVHLLGHDWGSIQCWAAITDDSVSAKVASFTSISGPHLNYAGKFLRSARTPRAVADVAKQIMASSYIWFFLCPGAPEIAIRTRATVKVFEAVERIGRSSTRSRRHAAYRSIRDYLNGLNLYRANMPAPMLAPPKQLPQTTVPVQVLVARKDYFVSPALQRFTGSIPARRRIVQIEGGHWVVTSRPDVIARLTSEWVDRVTEGAAAPGEPGVDTGPRDVTGKLALVTGAGGGIGRATALELARHGARAVVIVDRDLPAAEQTADAVRGLGAESAVYQADVSDDAAMNNVAAQVLSKHGVVDILVNNAGIGMAGRFLETTPQHWDTIIGINVRGVINGCRAFGSQMVERGQGGTIVNVASAAAFVPSKSMVAYGTTKAAVLALSESLRADLADEGITVTAVCPGFVNTNIAKSTVYAGMTAEQQEQARQKADAAYRRRNYPPEAVAKAIVKAVNSGPAVLPIAAESRVGYALRRISPSLLRLFARFDIRPT
ncbi:short chain dehydrogenase [Mycobacterium heckeshornense]|uniref:Short chain dehydrogenase n=1 Tax=Mycobacterium heckeshornense TaxID=110505 RepID=A0A2G8B4A7_9MYCO|nr:SDR family oxidoreductase [Mycobacterium heckeshornense]KMV22455.1 short-chain dehydrogenase [Mycobacterium heckeshornense]MCV7034719.1 SDR family oxidoreductase [Mycobacterium heckeshornense]PIJ32578.1 short chain dehydrogenase [Mycobacterium heckeshornense]BCO36821.1 short chain dehydrogenase [Mycobacterium heckeshornense]